MTVNINAANISGVKLVEGAAPSTPAAGSRVLYAKTTGLFLRDDAGNEYQISPDVIGTAYQMLRVNSGATGIEYFGAYTSFTPSLDQAGAIAKTVTQASYLRVGANMDISIRLDITAAGTAGNSIRVGNLPAAAVGTDPIVGNFLYYDNGTGFYAGSVLYITATGYLQCYAHGQTSSVGVTPNIATANGDVLWLNLSYSY